MNRSAVNQSAGHSETLNNVGVALSSRGELADAERCFRFALRLAPTNPFLLNNLGNALRRQGRIEEAVAELEKAIAYRSDFVEAYDNLGIAFAAGGRLTEAAATFRQAVRLKPAGSAIQSRLGSVLTALGHPHEALPCFDAALSRAPDDAEAHVRRALALLAMGDFERGWTEYEWRWQLSRVNKPRFKQPLWDGSDLRGGAILLRSEQGLGDTLQFVRYAPLVKERVGTVILQAQPALVPILRGASGVDEVVADGDTLPEFDVHAPLLSLPRIFRTTPTTVPAETPYLVADPVLVREWARKLSGIAGVRVGIAWQGNPDHPEARTRAIPLESFARLADIPGVRLISLQKGAGREQLLDVDFSIADLGDSLDGEHGSFMDTAAIMSLLDLVVTSDSAVSHLAGALGVPVWVGLASSSCHFTYLRTRNDCPWYPNMRVFRQNAAGDWCGVFQAMRDRLTATVANTKSGVAVPVELSPGDLIDRITILEIKRERFRDPAKLEQVRRELAALVAARDRWVRASPALDVLTDELMTINEALWEQEDEIHRCDREADLGHSFVQTARRILHLNHRRAEAKRRINDLLGSKFTEEKDYASASGAAWKPAFARD